MEQIKKLLPGTKRTFKEGAVIIYQSEAPRSGFFICKGLVKSYTLGKNGEEHLVNFYGPGDFLPNSWLFGGMSSSLYYYETVIPTELIAVMRSDINSIREKHPTFEDYIVGYLGRNHSALSMRITALEQSKAVDKLAFTIYYLLYMFGKPNPRNDLYDIHIGLTHSMLASLTGLTRETTASEMGKLRRKGIITYKGKDYKVDRKKLENSLGEDSFRELID